MEDKDSKRLENLENLLITIALKTGVKYEGISDATGINVKTLKNKFQIKRIGRVRKD